MKRYFLPLMFAVTGLMLAESSALAQFQGSGGSGFTGGGSSGGFRPSSSNSGLNRRGSGNNSNNQFGTGQFISPLRGSQGQGMNGGFNNGQNNFGGRNNQFGRQGGGQGNFGNNNMNRGARLNAYAFQVPALPADPDDIQPRLQEILNGGSTTVDAKASISLRLDDKTLVLMGTVANVRQKQLAEAMVRLEPGVYDVRNELIVGGVVKPAGK